ncbi:MAG TPA: family 43 glycosylhydrolase, partial [Acidimicrobiales bacterium]|nr:family 43 glycosylhydrolase [Acidimicrobiales bacterium]
MPTYMSPSCPTSRVRIGRRLRRAALAAGCSLVLGACSTAAAIGTSSTTGPTTTGPTTTAPTTLPFTSTTSTTPTLTTAPPPTGEAAAPALVTTPNENLPDPFILKVPGGYELYASQTGLYGPTIPTAFSTTIYHWPAVHAAMPEVPSWATFGFTWAPDVRRLDGRYVMYFDSLVQPSIYFDRAGSGFSQYAQCIGVATSSAPEGPFVGQSHPL